MPLADEAMEILLARRGNGSSFVFPSGRSRRAANGGGPGVLTENRLAAALRSMAPRLARLGVESFTPHRSEEHTSELQSLMRISYAAFCLKKKKNKTQTHINYPHSTILYHETT